MNNISQSRLLVAGAVAIPALLLTKHFYNIYAATAPVPWRSITEVRSMPDSLRNSASVTTIINPRGHPSLDDTRFIDVSLPESASYLKDETVLAALLRGFFGGHVFAPERAVLKLAGLELTNYPTPEGSSPPPAIWDSKRLDGDTLPALHTILFGAFKVIHVELGTSSPQHSSSTIDLAFGSSKGQFGGVHRFTILRDGEKPGVIRVALEHTSCNPTVNKPLKPDIMIPFHNFYAMWLFRESVAELVQRFAVEKKL